MGGDSWRAHGDLGTWLAKVLGAGLPNLDDDRPCFGMGQHEDHTGHRVLWPADTDGSDHAPVWEGLYAATICSGDCHLPRHAKATPPFTHDATVLG